MPVITFTRDSFELEKRLRKFCPPDSINSVNSITAATKVIQVDVAAEGQDDCIEFMEGQGFSVTLIV